MDPWHNILLVSRIILPPLKNFLPQTEATSPVHVCYQSRRFLMPSVQQRATTSFLWLDDLNTTYFPSMPCSIVTLVLWVTCKALSPFPIGYLGINFGRLANHFMRYMFCKRTVYDLPDWLKVYSAQLTVLRLCSNQRQSWLSWLKHVVAFTRSESSQETKIILGWQRNKSILRTRKKEPGNSKVCGRRTVSGWSTTGKKM